MCVGVVVKRSTSVVGVMVRLTIRVRGRVAFEVRLGG